MPLWDRDTKIESSLHFSAFESYRNLGPTRNIDKAWRSQHPTADESKRAPSHWWKWQEDHNWKGRAEAWDKHNEKIEREAHEEELRKVGKRRARFEVAFQERIERRFDKVEEQLGKAEAAPITDIVRDDGVVTTKIKGTNLSGYARLNQEWRATGRQAVMGPREAVAEDKRNNSETVPLIVELSVPVEADHTSNDRLQ